MTIHLGAMLPTRSSDLPGNSGGPPLNVPLFGLAPDGVYQAPIVTDETGELLPHLFTLTLHPVYREITVILMSLPNKSMCAC